MDLFYIIIQMEIFMKENGKKIKKKGYGIYHFSNGDKYEGKQIKKKFMEFLIFQMMINMREDRKMEKWMDLGYIVN